MANIVPKGRDLLSVSNFFQEGEGITCSSLHRFLLRALGHSLGSNIPIHREDAAPCLLG